MTKPTSLPFTGDPEADRLLADDPLALLIGFALDQQVTVQKAFSGPAELKRRLGHLDAARIAAMDPAELDAVFRERRRSTAFRARWPARSRRWPRRSRPTTATTRPGLVGGRRWADLEARLLGLPGIGEMKAKSIIAVLGKRFGVRPPGYDDVAPTWPTLGDVDSAEALAAYQAGKRAKKAAARAAGA